MEDIKPHHILIPGIALAISALVHFFFHAAMPWLQGLQQPDMVVPVWILSVMWQVSLTGVALSALRVVDRMWFGIVPFIALLLFGALAWLTVHWAYQVFYEQQLGIGLLEALILECVCLMLMLVTSYISRAASLLLIPYAGFIVVVFYCTYLMWRVNEAVGLMRFL